MAQDQQQIPDWLLNMSADSDQQEMSLRDFFRVIPYQKKWFLGIALTCLLLGAAAIQLLPKSYIVESSIMMEREDTFSANSGGERPESLNLRMRSIIATLLSSGSAVEMLESLGLLTAATPADEKRFAIQTFKESVIIEFDNVSFINESTGREAEYSLGFSVSYENPSAEISFLGAKEITDRILSYSSDRISEHAKVETEFLRRNLDKAAARLQGAETELTEFKRANSQALPHMRDVSLRRIEATSRRILDSGVRLAALRDRLEDVEAQLQTVAVDTAVYSTTGTRIVSPEDQLVILELEHTALSNKYSKDHPDVVRVQEEIDALKTHIGKGATSGGIDEELANTRQKLSTLQERYSDEHPEIGALKEKIVYLRGQLASGNTRSREKLGASNPVYNNLLSRKRSVTSEINIERREQASMRIELIEIEKGLELIPGAEQELRGLEKVRTLAEKKHAELEEELDVTLQNVEERAANLSEKFVLLEPPTMPQGPAKPNKLVLMLVVTVLSFLLAYIFVFIRHMLKDTIIESKDIEGVTKLPVFLVPEFK